MLACVINKEGGSLVFSLVQSIYMQAYVVFLSFMMWDRGQSIDTRIRHVPQQHQNGRIKPNLNFSIYKNISNSAWQSFDLSILYSATGLNITEDKEKTSYVQLRILITKSPSITSRCQSNRKKISLRFQLCAVNEISRAKILSILLYYYINVM